MMFATLEPEFVVVRVEPAAAGHGPRPSKVMTRVATPAEADGVMFLCPTCFARNGGPVGTHSVVCYKHKVPLTITPGPGRWGFSGSGPADLSLTPSVHLSGGCGSHFYITNGQVRML